MRPKRRGTSCCIRVLFASSKRLRGSGRSGSGAHAAWLERGALLRSALPAAERSAREVKRRSHSPGTLDGVVVVVIRLLLFLLPRKEVHESLFLVYLLYRTSSGSIRRIMSAFPSPNPSPLRSNASIQPWLTVQKLTT